MMQLDMVLTSLQKNSHVATLLGFSVPSSMGGTNTPSRSLHNNTQLVEVLMKKLLCNFAFEIVSSIQYSKQRVPSS